MRTLASEWSDFAAMVLAADAAPIQRAEMKRAFYAGALCTLTSLADAVGGPEASAGETVARLARRIEELRTETLAFGRARLAADAGERPDP